LVDDCRKKLEEFYTSKVQVNLDATISAITEEPLKNLETYYGHALAFLAAIT
jgi:hypothetical protein